MSEPTLSRRALNRTTLARQMLLQRETADPVTALERIGGVQAQLARPPFLALWARTDRFRRDDLVRAIGQRDVIRATMMRATLHLFSRRDYLAFRPVLQPALTASAQGIVGKRLDGVDLKAVVAAAREWFAETPCTFDDLRGRLRARFPAADARALAYAVRMHLPLVQVPEPGATWAYPARADFTAADTWVGELVTGSLDARDLVRRYLMSFGPASVGDLQRWSGLGSVRLAFEELRPRLRRWRDELGRQVFDVPEGRLAEGDEQAPVRFLPEFDNVLLGYQERTRILADEHRARLVTRNLLVPAMFLVDGFVAGTWRLEKTRSTTRLIAEPFGRLSKAARRDVAEEGERLLRFAEPTARTFSVELGPFRRSRAG